jgi:hypothetical protein
VQKKHHKIFYTSGLISLIVLPIILSISIFDDIGDAIHYGSIEVRGNVGYGIALPKDSVYILQLKNNQIDFIDFEQFLVVHKHGLASGKIDWKNRYRITLPDSIKYGTLVHFIDILQKNKFLCGITANTIRFVYYPNQYTEPQVVRLTIKQEFEYLFDRSKSIISSLRQRLSGNPPIRIMKYSDEGPAPFGLGDHVFYANYITVDEPKSAVLFDALGLWFLPILLGWFVLLYLGLQRN